MKRGSRRKRKRQSPVVSNEVDQAMAEVKELSEAEIPMFLAKEVN
jgi:hypothetical protein